METVAVQKVFTKTALAKYLGLSRQAVYDKMGSGEFVPDVNDADGVPTYFSEENAARLKSERDARLGT